MQLRSSLIFSFLGLYTAGLAFLSFFSINFVFSYDLAFLLGSLFSIMAFKSSLNAQTFLISLYFVTFFGLSYIAGVSTFDILLSTKFFLIILLLINIKPIATNKYELMRLARFIIVIFLVSYSFQSLLGEVRPKVFVENNFEIPFVLLFVGLLFFLNDRRKNLFFLFALLIIFMSGSRSGLFSLFACSIIFYLKNYKMILALTGLFSFSILYFFYEILPPTDRLFFFEAFFQTFTSRSIENILFGNLYLIELDPHTCYRFRYYSELFSFQSSSTCYSNIFHMMNIRVINDFGLVGLTLFFLIINSSLKKICTYKAADLITLLFLLNGFSVSGLNNNLLFLGAVIVAFSMNKSIIKN